MDKIFWWTIKALALAALTYFIVFGTLYNLGVSEGWAEFWSVVAGAFSVMGLLECSD